MKAEACQLKKLYETLNKAYVIPLYQRPFAWSPEKSTDLLKAIFEDANGGESMTSIGTFLFCDALSGKKHPFGSGNASSVAPSTIWEVVDGQQRLTVLAIIGYVLNEKLKSLAGAGLSYNPPIDLEQLFSTYRRRSKSVPVLIRDGDNYDKNFKSDVALLLSSFSGTGPIPPGKIGESFKEVLLEISNWVNANLSTGKAFVKFCDYFLTKCYYIQVEADDQDTAFSMFEPLNSTSEPLTAFEVYRSKVVRQIPKSANFPKMERFIDYHNSKRDEVIKRSNDVIFSTAQVVSGLRPRINFVKLKKFLDVHVDKTFVMRLESSAEFYRTIWNDQILKARWFDEETKNCIRFLRASNHDASVPLLIRYFQTNQADFPEVAKAIVAFFALWRPVFPTNSLPDVYRNLFTEGSADNMALDGGKLKKLSNLKAYFRKKLEDRLGNPQKGQSYLDLWLDEDRQIYLSYDQLRTICRLFIFLDMGSSIKSNLVPDDPWTALDDIDHILPSSSATPAASINKVGNLTFLPPTINKSIQDMHWKGRKSEVYKLLATPHKTDPSPEKFSDGEDLPMAVRAYLAEPDTLSLAHLQKISNSTKWGEAQIKKRTDLILRSVWKVLYEKWLH